MPPFKLRPSSKQGPYGVIEITINKGIQMHPQIIAKIIAMPYAIPFKYIIITTSNNLQIVVPKNREEKYM